MGISLEADFLAFITPIYIFIIGLEILVSHFAGKKYYNFRDMREQSLLYWSVLLILQDVGLYTVVDGEGLTKKTFELESSLFVCIR